MVWSGAPGFCRSHGGIRPPAWELLAVGVLLPVGLFPLLRSTSHVMPEGRKELCSHLPLPLIKLCALGEVPSLTEPQFSSLLIRRLKEGPRVILKMKCDNTWKALLVNSEMLWRAVYYKHHAPHHRLQA